MADDDLTRYDDVVPKQDANGAVQMEGEQPDEGTAMFQVFGDDKIPVSKKRGSLWKARLDAARKSSAHQKRLRAWKEAVRYYNHDQTRDTSHNDASSVSGTGTSNMRETENIVFANVSALVPMLYTKNPDAEFTAQSEETKQLANLLERLMKKLAGQVSTPGINLKPAVKRNIVMATLANCAWLEVGYTLRDQSSDAAREQLQQLSKQLQDAKTTEEIKEIEGKLIALEQTVDMLQPSGPWRKVRAPWDVFIDPASDDLDLTSTNWIIIRDKMSTMLLRARYGRKDMDSKEWKSLYEPTHVLKAGTDVEDGNITGDNFVLFEKSGNSQSYKEYGYEDEGSFKCAQMTEVFYVWDKATRRCELYSAASWKWPVWVWDDPYRLDTFFPISALSFHTDPVQAYAKGEVTYYLDQQDTLNLMNNEFSRIRGFASSLVAYNKNKVKDTTVLDQMMAGTYDKRTIGLDLDEGDKLSDVVGPLLPVSAEAAKFFDKRPILEAIDRISGVSSVQRGVEYKTNTTNRAIESYESQMQTRADEKMDAIEEHVGRVLWMVAQMCLQFMTAEEVQKLVGTSEGWTQIEPSQIPLMFTPRVVGGSTLKPTTRAKKEQALQMSQVIGQFAKATPAAALVALKVLKEAFGNELVVTDQDWELVMQGIQSQIAAAQAQAQGAAQQGQQQQRPPSGDAGGEATGNVVEQTLMEAGRLLDSLSADMKEQIGVMLARQVPVQQIIGAVISKLEAGAAQ